MTDKYAYGVVVDYEGFFVAALRWLKTTLPPNPNNKFRLENRKLHKIITSIEATTDPIENGKWDEASKTWLSPTDKVWIVDSNGQLRGQRMVWPTRRKPLPKGFAYIDIEPPKSRARKPIWNGSEWIQPRVVAVIVDNTIKSAGIENPRDDIENVNDVTNDDTRTEYPWPLLPSGEPARIGDTYNEVVGEWEEAKELQIPIEEKRASASMSRAEFAKVCATQGWITEAEALSWAGGSAIPAFVNNVIEQFVPQEDWFDTKLLVLTAERVHRDNPMVALLMLKRKVAVTDVEMDAVFGIEP